MDIKYEHAHKADGRYPESPIHVQNMDSCKLKKGDIVAFAVSAHCRKVFQLKQDPYRYVFSRRAPPEPSYIDWVVSVGFLDLVSTTRLRLATKEEIDYEINLKKKLIAELEDEIKELHEG